MGLWEALEYVGESLVLLGVVGEVFSDWREGNRLAKVSSLVLMLGLALSLAALRRTNEYFNETIAGLNLKASQANERAKKDEADEAVVKSGTFKLGIELENAKADTEKLTKRAAEANRAADQERIASLRLEKEIAPRRIGDAQAAALWRTCVSSLPFRRVAVVSYTLDLESAILAGQIEQALKCGRKDFVVVDRRSGQITFGGFIAGIEITGSDNSLVDSLRGDLSPLPILPKNTPSPISKPSDGAPVPSATILIGVKPLQ